MNKKPDIFYFDDYKKYLNAFYSYKKSVDKTFSYRKFARILGMRYHSNLTDIIQGKRKLSFHMLEKLASGLKLNNAETDHLQTLTYVPNARVKYMKASKDNIFFLEVLLTTFISFPEFKPDPRWIEKLTGKIISKESAKRAFQWLLKHKILQLKDGKWICVHERINVNVRGVKNEPAARLQFRKNIIDTYRDYFPRSHEHFMELTDIIATEEEYRKLLEDVRSLIYSRTLKKGQRVQSSEKEIYLFLLSTCSITKRKKVLKEKKSSYL